MMTLTQCFEILTKNGQVTIGSDEMQRAAMLTLKNYDIVEHLNQNHTYRLCADVGFSTTEKGYIFHVKENEKHTEKNISVVVNDQLFSAHKEDSLEKVR